MKFKITILSVLFLLTISTFAQREAKSNSSKGLFFKHQKMSKENHTSPFEITDLNKQLQAIASSKQALDSLVWSEEAKEPNALVNTYKSIYSYNDKGKLIVEDDFSYDGETWTHEAKDEIEYYESGYLKGNIFSYLGEGSNELTNYYKIEYFYDADWLLSESKSYNWNDAKGEWIETLQSLFTYNDNNEVEKTEIYYWEESLKGWVLFFKYDYTYNEGNLVEQISSSWNQTDWTPNWKDTYTYENNKVTLEVNAEWEQDLSEWKDLSKTENTYNAENKMLTSIGSNYMESTWTPMWKDTYTYGSNGDLELMEWFDWAAGVWEIKGKEEVIYNGEFTFNDLILPFYGDDEELYFNHMAVELTDYMYESNEWIIDEKGNFYYSEKELNAIIEHNGIEYTIYPNPTSHYITFDIRGNSTQFTLELFDIQGRKLLSKEIINKEEVNIENLTSGMYFYTLVLDGEKITGKILKK